MIQKRFRDSGAIHPTFNQAKNHNKRFGGLELEYFGGSDVANKLMEKLLYEIRKI